ncbi:MAG TPA: 4-hydroxythreonine-4-phosphate dehydrogenase PdxA [Burkholderiales bacterium]
MIAVTSGEPAGIGPDICLALARDELAARVVVLGDRHLLEQRAAALGIEVRLSEAGSTWRPGALAVEHVPLAVPSIPGVLDPRNARYVIAQLDRALDGCLSGRFAAMVTAPVHKAAINDAGIAFTGHTEFLAERTRTPHVVMMLAGGGLRVALATTHMAVKDVPGALSPESLEATIRVLAADLRRRFGVESPRILVAGLNPHGGEGGHFGREEIELIAPVLERLRAEGLRLAGPLPADTLFTPDVLSQGDCVLAMYHDQGLPVLKYASFGRGINITLGLPIIRTSVDHGTALDLAGTGKADAGSLLEAVRAAAELWRTAAGVPR